MEMFGHFGNVPKLRSKASKRLSLFLEALVFSHSQSHPQLQWVPNSSPGGGHRDARSTGGGEERDINPECVVYWGRWG